MTWWQQSLHQQIYAIMQTLFDEDLEKVTMTLAGGFDGTMANVNAGTFIGIDKGPSERTGIPVAEIYGVVTFYSYFSLKPKGKYVIGVCLGTACYVKGSQQVIDTFSEILGIKPGETTEDGLFTLDALRCIGACGIAPAVSISGKVYSKVSVKEDKQPVPPQTNR